MSQRESRGKGICSNGDKKVFLKNGLAYFDHVTKKSILNFKMLNFKNTLAYSLIMDAFYQ